MRRAPTIATILVMLAADSGWARCPGDFNLDETTTVDEIVAAVDSALNGCPLPVGCPLRFDQRAGEDELCVFVGRYHPLCGFSNLEATFFSNGEDLIVSFFNPDIDFFAEVVDDGIAVLYAWQDVGDPPQEPVEIEGEVLLSDPPREALTVSPFEIPFGIEDCDFERYEGRFAEYLALSPASGSAATVTRRAARQAATTVRLRTLQGDARLSRMKQQAMQRRQQAGQSRTPRRSATAARLQLDMKP
jgi:hypothetical protein